MRSILRPNSIEVLDDLKARNTLRRYFEVLEGRRSPKVKLCKSLSVEVSLNESDEVLWKGHEAGVARLRSMEKEEGGESSQGRTSLLDLKVELAKRIFNRCVFCERRCGVDRREKAGSCGVREARISSLFHHYGEEPELVPSYTVFFSGCNFHCQFCQNYDISQRITGFEVQATELASKLEGINARNINWVGGEPTANLHYILETLNYYSGGMPSVWNSNMYMTEESMKLLEGTQDVFLTDFKYGNDACSTNLSKVKDYTAIVKRNHRLAQRQGELIVRHLVLPGHIECCTAEVAGFVAKVLGVGTRFNLMFQYRPLYKAYKYNDINRGLTSEEVSKAWRVVEEAGLENVIT